MQIAVQKNSILKLISKEKFEKFFDIYINSIFFKLLLIIAKKINERQLI